uniref:Sin3 histone deacetylase corepressor complex component sds3 n=1 Tax=Angiostrongylus cantonensis TaxID=6313 RepID=A0A0K0DJQ9_ANGCA
MSSSTRLEALYEELKQIDDGTHPEYLAKLREIEELYEEQKEREQIAYELALERIDYEYKRRVQQAKDDFERKEKELMQGMLAELDEMEKRIEWEYSNMDVSRVGNGNIIDSTKKTLRGRGGILVEPPTYFNATPKPSTQNITPDTRYLLTDSEIAEDVRAFSGDQSSPHKIRFYLTVWWDYVSTDVCKVKTLVILAIRCTNLRRNILFEKKSAPEENNEKAEIV